MNTPQDRRSHLFSQSIDISVRALVKPIYKKHGFADHRILTEWQEIVGKELAAFSVPQKLVTSRPQQGGTLHILVASGRAVEIQHMQPQILDRIATYFGYRAVTQLRFTQTSAPLFYTSARKLPPKKQAFSETLCEMVQACEDAELREALLALGKTLRITDPRP